MQYFLLFGFIGAILAIGLYSFIGWLRKRNTGATWYEWLMGITGIVLLLMAIQHFFGAMSELFPFAAWMGLVIIGVPAIVLLAITWQLISRRSKQV
ncbi:hypothetical protein [Dehalococcoides sp. UCH007]|uniref:hypothetical protein n=1 Tax=Dehalococcoides sp. UCH007 TaxID=1522671 RepID=UPI0005B56558|nr:hypothetical protein [Dehalococcoides sp. UCH007]BAQ34944.1 putative reductive dehalogenase membrane anchoring protein [Dehalococcoides sp. UCH007]